MNKTIIININGIVFHIEEDAYEVLKNYMTEIKRHFAYSADCEEIITDIENRLAEMFSERLADHTKQVIVLQDVEEVTATMGSIKDFDYETGENGPEQPKVEKRLLRDPDDKSLAGVCAGLGHYLHIEAKWVRIAFVLFAVTTGVTILLYAILWIVVPEARTRQEKMEMKGEAINLQNFKKNFETEADSSNSFNQSAQKAGNVIESVIISIVDFLTRIAKVIFKSVGLLIVIAGAMAFVALIAGLIFGIGFLNNTELDFLGLHAINSEYKSPLYFSAFILLIIPLVALISFAVRVVFDFRILSKTGSFAMLVLWLTGLGVGIYYGSSIAAEFKEGASFEQFETLKLHPVYHLSINRNRLLTQTDSLNLGLTERSFNGRILDDNDQDFDEMNFSFEIQPSEKQSVVLVKEYKSRGKNFEDALHNAQGTLYHVLQQDSTLFFDKHLRLLDGARYRKQELHLILKIPVGTKLIIDHDLSWHARNFDLWGCRRENEDENKPAEVIMTSEGLKCVKDIAQEEENTEEQLTDSVAVN